MASTATRDLPIQQAGAGAGVYNTTRPLGSAAISALISNRIAAQHLYGRFAEEGSGMGKLPSFVVHPFGTALSQSMYLPAAILLIGVIASALFVRGGRATPGALAETDRVPLEPER
ncbi:hypothetical protein ABIA39_007734 [Nocardia sp. GAS34]